MNRTYIDIPSLLIIASMAIVVSCGGGGGGGGGGDRFPTPTLPADAMKFDATNANETADTAMGFATTFSQLPLFKPEAAPSIPQIVDSALDEVIEWIRNPLPVAAKTDDISAGLCNSGSAITESSESGSSASGDITFSNCDIGGVILNGNFAFDASWNDATQDYNFHTGGTLVIRLDADSITVQMNLNESGNDGTGDFSTDISFSMSGISDAAFLVETAQPLTGNYFTQEVTAGQLIAYGAERTRLRITVTTANAADVELDAGGGSFTPHSGIMF